MNKNLSNCEDVFIPSVRLFSFFPVFILYFRLQFLFFSHLSFPFILISSLFSSYPWRCNFYFFLIFFVFAFQFSLDVIFLLISSCFISILYFYLILPSLFSLHFLFLFKPSQVFLLFFLASCHPLLLYLFCLYSHHLSCNIIFTSPPHVFAYILGLFFFSFHSAFFPDLLPLSYSLSSLFVITVLFTFFSSACHHVFYLSIRGFLFTFLLCLLLSHVEKDQWHSSFSLSSFVLTSPSLPSFSFHRTFTLSPLWLTGNEFRAYWLISTCSQFDLYVYHKRTQSHTLFAPPNRYEETQIVCGICAQIHKVELHT